MAISHNAMSMRIFWAAFFFFSFFLTVSLVVAFLFSLSLTVPFLSGGKDAIVTVNVHAARDLLASGYRLLDVRTKEEFAKGHVKDAINVPYLFFTPQGKQKNPRFTEEVSAIFSKNDPIVVICRNGVRSPRACNDLLKSGFKNLKNVGKGFASWVDNGLDLQVQQLSERESMAAEQHKEATSAKVNGSAETGSADISKLVCGRRFRDVSNEAVVTVNVYAAKDLLATGHSFLDVRTKEEFSKGHVKNAINVPYVCLTPRGREKNPTFLEEVSGVCSKDGHIIVSCNGGGRSSSASADLRNAGFKNVKSLGGGFRAWVDSGFDVESPEDETTR
ncbi:uncharacterized protein LOC116260717 [Nymphaea colorata]|nr:uncharacterized protein LOC116260717 [Nymphaea colorata]